MVYLLGFCIFAFLLYRFPPLRKATLATAALGVLLIGLIFFSQSMEESAAKTLIPKEQIQISNLALSSGYGLYHLNGELRNNSGHELTGLTMSVTAYDCPGAAITAACTIIGEDKNVGIFVDVPTNQVRSISDAIVSFNNMPTVKGQFLWSYGVEETRGQN